MGYVLGWIFSRCYCRAILDSKIRAGLKRGGIYPSNTVHLIGSRGMDFSKETQIIMPDPIVKFTLDVTAQCDTQLEGYCVAFLTERGFNVTRPNDRWEKMGDFLSRVRLHPEGLRRKLRQPDCPNVRFQYSKSPKSLGKQRLAILSNKDFDAYCVANK